MPIGGRSGVGSLEGYSPTTMKTIPKPSAEARVRPAGDAEAQTSPRRWDWRGYSIATAVVAAATCVGLPLHRSLGMSDTNVLTLYLFGVLCVAIRLSRRAAVLAAVLGVLAFDYAFVPPYYTLDVH